jgi:predicted AlkP superfamily phosphohydrolase/phosphomutase
MGGGKGVVAHKLDGILFLKGPGVGTEANVSTATVLDVAPTILALFGLPAARGMEGRPIEEALTAATMKRVAREATTSGAAGARK